MFHVVSPFITGSGDHSEAQLVVHVLHRPGLHGTDRTWASHVLLLVHSVALFCLDGKFYDAYDVFA